MDAEILYRDKSIIVCVKPVGVQSESPGMPELLDASGEVLCVHRLDKAVGGVMVYALTGKAAAALSGQIASGQLRKEYYAVLPAAPPEKSGTLRDLLFHDKAHNKTFVVDRARKGVKAAELDYITEGESEGSALVHVFLRTGRSHQIRVQFASRKLPLLGDGKYGSRVGGCDIALVSTALELVHPDTGKKLRFEIPLPDRYPFNLFYQGEKQK